MKYIGYVSAEGGPLILMGAKTVSHWRGVEGDEPTDYDRACNFFEREPPPEGGIFQAGPGKALLWEMSGAGTAHVFKSDDAFIIVRAWLNEDIVDSCKDHDGLIVLAETDGRDCVDLGVLDVAGDTLLLLWSTENASSITSFGEAGRIPAGDFSVEDSALVLGRAVGSCACFHENVEASVGSARKLIVRVRNG